MYGVQYVGETVGLGSIFQGQVWTSLAGRVGYRHFYTRCAHTINVSKSTKAYS